MSLTGGPNLYGWIGLIGFAILSLVGKSFWPIGIFLAVNGVVGLTAVLIQTMINRRHG
jgi:hypothetical protein